MTFIQKKLAKKKKCIPNANNKQTLGLVISNKLCNKNEISANIKAILKLIVLHPGRLRNEENNVNVIKVIANANIERVMAIVDRNPGAFSKKLSVFPFVVPLV